VEIFVTGGTGYLGGRLVRRLLQEGHRVRMLYRDPKGLPPGNAQLLPVRGDLGRADSLSEAIRGCDAVVHTAAMVKSLVRRPAEMHAINVDAVRDLIAVSREQGVSRFVYTSSFMALGPATGAPRTEADDPTRSSFHNLYEETKYLGDQVARQAAADGAPVITLYPTVVFGPGTLTDGNLVGKIVRDFVRGRLPGRIGRGDATWNYGFVEDVVDGHVRALQHAEPGSRYILGGENVTMDGFLDTLEEVTGVPAPTRRLPRPMTTAVAFLMESWARITGGQPDLTRETLGIYEKDWAYSIDAARRDLGYAPTPFVDAVTRTAEWARSTLDRQTAATVAR